MMHVRKTLATLLALAATPAAAQSWECAFSTECVLPDPCETDTSIEATLANSGGDWSLTLSDVTLALEPQDGQPGASTHFLVRAIDRDADALALLSLFEDGTAILSAHGGFPSPGAVTHLGTCKAVAE